MNWIPLHTDLQLQQLIEQSAVKPQLIFKHSTTCSISSMAKNRLERQIAPPNIDFYFLDLLAYRPLSRAVSEQFNVQHQSPQVLLIKNGQCIYDESHTGISMDEIEEQSQ